MVLFFSKLLEAGAVLGAASPTSDSDLQMSDWSLSAKPDWLLFPGIASAFWRDILTISFRLSVTFWRIALLLAGQSHLRPRPLQIVLHVPARSRPSYLC